MKYNIRKATIYDINQIYEIENLCFNKIDRFSKDFFYLFLLGRKYEIFLVATIENTKEEIVIGFIVAYLNSINNYEIATVNVHPEWRRIGAGYNLMLQLEEAVVIIVPELRNRKMIDTNSEEITIELTVQTENEAAKNIYHKLEYKQIEVIPDYYKKGSAGIRMVKKLKISL